MGCCRRRRASRRRRSGPPLDTRVVGLVNAGSWAQLATVPTSRLAAIPDDVADAQAATLPTAGLTALRALELAGLVLGRRVLVTGANGGVGRMTVQLAHESGAIVTALVRDASASDALFRRLGAAEVVEEIGDEFDLIIDAVGGRTFGQASSISRRAGRSSTSRPRAKTRPSRFGQDVSIARKARKIYTLNLFDELDAHGSGSGDLARLCRLMADGRLDGQVELECSWREAAVAHDALLERRIGGKAVLHVD